MTTSSAMKHKYDRQKKKALSVKDRCANAFGNFIGLTTSWGFALIDATDWNEDS